MIKKKKKRPKVASLNWILSLSSLIFITVSVHLRAVYLSGLALEQIGFSK
jgi:hypothetical protein